MYQVLLDSDQWRLNDISFNPILTGLFNTRQNQGRILTPFLIRLFFSLKA